MHRHLVSAFMGRALAKEGTAVNRDFKAVRRGDLGAELGSRLLVELERMLAVIIKA